MADNKWDEDELIMVSAVEHYSYCPRQCALIHVEQTFEENIYTLRGRAAHERVDETESTIEDGVRVERALPIWSDRLGLVGKADVVEFHDQVPYPVDYKHGPKRPKEHDDLQLCAEAICLQEMFGKYVPKGAIYHVTSRHRREVHFDEVMRLKVEEVVVKIREMLIKEIVPKAIYNKKCEQCSLLDSCLPEITDPVYSHEKKLLHQLFIPSEEV